MRVYYMIFENLLCITVVLTFTFSPSSILTIYLYLYLYINFYLSMFISFNFVFTFFFAKRKTSCMCVQLFCDAVRFPFFFKRFHCKKSRTLLFQLFINDDSHSFRWDYYLYVAFTRSWITRKRLYELS